MVSLFAWQEGGEGGDRWLDHELAVLENIPVALLKQETERREKARKQYLAHLKACKENPDFEEENPPEYDIRIWWKDPVTGERNWIKRLPLPAGEVRQWRTALLSGDELERKLCQEPDSDYRTAGNKVLVEGRAYFRLLPGLGLCVFSGDFDLPGNYILGQYVGWLYCSDALAKHSSGSTEGTHKISLIHKASMPATVSGINGGPIQPDGEKYDLRYYWQNGPGSMANSLSKSRCNCRFEVEYPTQKIYERAPALFVDDEYCDQAIPYRQRVQSP